jgi:putative sporulation protein YtxC
MKQESSWGGRGLITIQFQKKEELNYLYTLLQSNCSDLIYAEKTPFQLIVQIADDQREQGIKLLHKHIKKLIMDKKRVDWCKKIIEERFFFSDEEEQIQIIDILYSILDGTRKEILLDIDHEKDESRIDEVLMDVLKSSHTFSFDAFLTFRLRTYLENLSIYIETAIDEYKLEQDYQAFIYYLRKFLYGRKAQMKYIHVIYDEGFIFYDENKHEMKRSELNKRIDRKLLSNHPVYVDSETIAPLISIAPDQIFLYTDHPEHGIIQTLKNIFEEKIYVQPIRFFQHIKYSEGLNE